MNVLYALLGCAAGLDAGTDTAADRPAVPDQDELPGGTLDSGEDDDEDLVRDEWGCSPLFDQEHVVAYEIDIAEEEWHILETQWRTWDGTKDYHPLERLTVDGVEVPDAMIRLKGNNSCCWVGEKMQFVLAFNEVDEDARVLGERKVALDSPYYDPTVLKNRLANWFMFRAGVEATCTNSATLTVNGEFFGLYANMEEMDHEFLERTFGDDDADGDLWKYGSVLDNHEDDEVDRARIDRFWSSYAPAETTAMGDPEQWVREWAAEAVLPDGDGYWCCGHNYYLYDHPTRGFLWIPWDKDGTFDWVPVETDPGTLWYPDYTPHMAFLLADPAWRARYVEVVAEQTTLYGTPEMQDALAEMVRQTYEAGLDDPHRYYDDATYQYWLDDLQAFLPARRAYLDRWVAAQAP